MNADPPLQDTPSAPPARPETRAGGGDPGSGRADIGEGLREAFQAVMDEPVPPVLTILAAELERRLRSRGGGSDGGDGGEQTPA